MRLRLGTLSRRVEDHGVERLEFVGTKRAAKKIARFAFYWLEALRSLGGARQGGDCRCVIIGGKHARAFTKAKRKRTNSAEQVGHRFGVCAMRLDQPRQCRFAGGGGLQERARRQNDLRPAHGHDRRSQLRHDVAVARESRQMMALRNVGKSGDIHCRQRSRSTQIHIKAGRGGGHSNVERLAHVRNSLGNGPGHGDCIAKARGEDGAVIYGDDAMGLAGGKSHFEHVAGAAARVENGAPASFAMGIDQFVYRRFEPDLCERIDDEGTLPLAIACVIPVLERAAAANSKMRTDRCDALGARILDLDQMAAVAMPRPRLGFDDFAGQGIRHVKRARRRVADAIAEPPDSRDGKMFSHVWLR